MVSVHSC